jgi:hypothetical protein
LALAASSCAKKKYSSSSQVAEQGGTREFKIQDEKPAFKVYLVGAVMATPDYDKVWSVIDSASSQGIIDNILQFATPIEGGIAHCIEIQDSSAREQLLESLKQVPTSLQESYYLIESVDNCL